MFLIHKYKQKPLSSKNHLCNRLKTKNYAQYSKIILKGAWQVCTLTFSATAASWAASCDKQTGQYQSSSLFLGNLRPSTLMQSKCIEMGHPSQKISNPYCPHVWQTSSWPSPPTSRKSTSSVSWESGGMNSFFVTNFSSSSWWYPLTSGKPVDASFLLFWGCPLSDPFWMYMQVSLKLHKRKTTSTIMH